MFELKQKAIKAAATFLDRRGYEVIDTEWESEDGSYIDVVARDEDAIVFCDVQARKGAEKGMPEEGLGPASAWRSTRPSGSASTGTTRTTWMSPSASTASRCWSSARTGRF